MEKALPWIIVGIVILVAAYLINQNKKTSATTQAVTAAVVANSAPCVPFTQAQQDAQKVAEKSKCASKLLIPFVGQVQYYSCLKQIDANLTPVKDC